MFSSQGSNCQFKSQVQPIHKIVFWVLMLFSFGHIMVRSIVIQAGKNKENKMDKTVTVNSLHEGFWFMIHLM